MSLSSLSNLAGFANLKAGTSLFSLYQQEKIALGLDFSDLSSVYLDDQGVGGPVTADGDTVGGAFDHALWGGKTMDAFIASQPALEEDDFDYESDAALRAVWTGVDGGISDISDPTVLTNPSPGVMRVTNNNGANAYARGVLALTGLTVGQAYVAAVTMVQQSSTPGAYFTINPDPDGSGVGQPYAASYNLSSAEDGTEATIIFVASNTTMYAGCWVNIPNNAEWAEWADFSLKALPGKHFLQSDTAKEPALRKRLKANADLSGETELVVNGDVSDGVTGWNDDTTNATVTEDSGEAVITIDANGAGYVDLEIAGLTVGEMVYATLDLTEASITNGVFASIRNSAKSLTTAIFNNEGTPGTYDILFRATTETHYLRIGGGSSALQDDYAKVDNVSAKQVPASQLYNVLYSGGVDELLTGEPFAYDQGGAVFVFGVNGEEQDTTIIYQEKRLSTTAPAYLIIAGAADNNKVGVYFRNDTGSSAGYPKSTAAILDGDPHVVTIIDTGNSVSFRVDGVDAGSSSYTRTGTLTLDIAALFAVKSTTETQWFAGDLGELFLVGDPAELSAADIRVMEAAVAQRMGVSLS